MYIFLFHSHCFHWVTVKSILYFLIKKQLSWRKIGMLLAWLTHKTLALSFPCASSNTSNSIVNHHKTNPYLSSPCHLEFHRFLSQRSLSISFISRSSTLPYKYLSHTFDQPVKLSLYLLYDLLTAFKMQECYGFIQHHSTLCGSLFLS